MVVMVTCSKTQAKTLFFINYRPGREGVHLGEKGCTWARRGGTLLSPPPPPPTHPPPSRHPPPPPLPPLPDPQPTRHICAQPLATLSAFLN